MRKLISVYSNDPKKRREQLTLEANIKPLIILAPSSRITLRGKKGEIKSSELFISAGLDKPLEVEPEKFTMKGKVSYRLEVVEKGRQYKINFQNIPEATGNFRGFLRISTNYSEKPEFTISINSDFN